MSESVVMNEALASVKIGQAIGASLAVGVTAVATAMAQARIGAAGCGAMAERPELGGQVFLFIALPETMVVLGFVVAALIIFSI